MTEFAMPHTTRPAPQLGVSFPDEFVGLVEDNYLKYQVSGRYDVESLFENEEQAKTFGKMLKAYSDNRATGKITIRYRVTDNAVRWYCKNREVRVGAPKTDADGKAPAKAPAKK